MKVNLTRKQFLAKDMEIRGMQGSIRFYWDNQKIKKWYNDNNVMLQSIMEQGDALLKQFAELNDDGTPQVKGEGMEMQFVFKDDAAKEEYNRLKEIFLKESVAMEI